jgi:hypothetical protein
MRVTFPIVLVALLASPFSDAFAQCERASKALIAADLGGQRTYANGAKLVRATSFGPTAGIDIVDGSAMGLPNQLAKVHWYKDRVAAVYLTWEPQTSSEAQQTIARLTELTRASRAPTLEGRSIELTCAGGVVGSLSMAKIVRAQDQQLIQLSLTHPYHDQMREAMRAQPAR